MKVEIFSLNAAVTGSVQGTTWSGDVPHEIGIPEGPDYGYITEDQSPDDINAQVETADEKWRQTILHILFRLFNRVDDSDVDRLIQWRYYLPSLSVGDYITLWPTGGMDDRTCTYAVQPFGFEKITGNGEILVREIVREKSE